MKLAELKDMSQEDLQGKLMELLKDQFNLRMKKSTGQLAQTHLLRETRRSIAQVKTVMHQKAGK